MGRGFLTGAFWGVIVGGIILFTAALVLESQRGDDPVAAFEPSDPVAVAFGELEPPLDVLSVAVTGTPAIAVERGPLAEVAVPVGSVVQAVTLSDQVPERPQDPRVLEDGVGAITEALPAAFPPADPAPVTLDVAEPSRPDLIQPAGPVLEPRPHASPSLDVVTPQKGLPARGLSQLAVIAQAPDPVRAVMVASSVAEVPTSGLSQMRRVSLATPPIVDLPAPAPIWRRPDGPLVAFIVQGTASDLPDWVMSVAQSDAIGPPAGLEQVRLDGTTQASVPNDPSTLVPLYRRFTDADAVTPETLQALRLRAQRDGRVAVLLGEDPAVLQAVGDWLAEEGAGMTPVPLSWLTR